MAYPLLRLGTAPDSWGVWFPSDPLQVSWDRYLDEVQAAGYTLTELGPYGYLPTDASQLRDELESRGLELSGGTVFAALHKGADALEQAKADCDREMRTIGPLGARHLIVLPEGYTDLEGRLVEAPTLTTEEWRALLSGMSELGRYVADQHGATLAFHTHADSHVGSRTEIERFLDGTDPATVQFCLDSGHVAYCGADNLGIVRDYPDRIGYVHLKQVDPAVLARVKAEGLGFAPAVRAGVMVEPPSGEPAMPELLAALAALGRELNCIVEQDLYPCGPDEPLPIATRTRTYFESLGLAGRPRTPT